MFSWLLCSMSHMDSLLSSLYLTVQQHLTQLIFFTSDIFLILFMQYFSLLVYFLSLLSTFIWVIFLGFISKFCTTLWFSHCFVLFLFLCLFFFNGLIHLDLTIKYTVINLKFQICISISNLCAIDLDLKLDISNLIFKNGTYFPSENSTTVYAVL